MVAAVKFHCFGENVAEKVHNLSSDQLVVALTNTAPSASGDSILTDITEITYTNLSSRSIRTSSSSQTGGVYSCVLADLTLTASGSVGPFRYVVIYNDTPTSPADPLIQYYDYGSERTLSNGETFTVNFGSSLLTIA